MIVVDVKSKFIGTEIENARSGLEATDDRLAHTSQTFKGHQLTKDMLQFCDIRIRWNDYLQK